MSNLQTYYHYKLDFQQGVQRTTTPLSLQISEWIAHSLANRLETVEFHIDPLHGRSICHALWPKVNPNFASNIIFNSHPFIPSESALPFLRYDNFNIWPWKSRVKVMGEVKVWSHNVSLASYWLTSLLFHVNGPSHSWDLYSIFKISAWKSKVKVKAEGHIVDITPYQLILLSFDVNQPSHSYI